MNVFEIPWKLVMNRLPRAPHEGGREMNRFHGSPDPEDDGYPEEWIGSDTRITGAEESGDPNLGCQKCVLPDGREIYLFEAIALDPEAALGKEHLKLIGPRTGILIKLLDFKNQLNLQTHPDRPYAKKWWNSDFGKAESWYILAKREDAAEAPYVYLGFKEGITRKDFEAGFYADDRKQMEACCHRIPVHAGDIFNVEAGVPHAVGPGCLILEVQEPTDINVIWRRKKDGTQEEQDYENERTLGCFHYDGRSFEENLKRFKITRRLLREGSGFREEVLIGTKETPYFSFTELEAGKPVPLLMTGHLQVGIVLEGEAELITETGSLHVKQADEFFVPAGVRALRLVPGEKGARVVLCHPAGVVR